MNKHKWGVSFNRDFFQQDAINLAKDILGKYLIREYDGIQIVSKIVETEAYMGVNDKAAHVYGDKKITIFAAFLQKTSKKVHNPNKYLS